MPTKADDMLIEITLMFSSLSKILGLRFKTIEKEYERDETVHEIETKIAGILRFITMFF